MRRISTGNEQSSLYIYYRRKILRSPYDVESTRESTRVLVVYGTYVKSAERSIQRQTEKRMS
jgi:hypothetical protein